MVAAQRNRGDLERERDSLIAKQAKLQERLSEAPGDKFFTSQLDRVGAKLEEIEKLLPPEEKPQPVQKAVREAPKADEALLRQVEAEKPQPFSKDASLLGAAILREVETEKTQEEKPESDGTEKVHIISHTVRPVIHVGPSDEKREEEPESDGTEKVHIISSTVRPIIPPEAKPLEFMERPDLAELALRTRNAIAASEEMFAAFQKETLAITEQLGPAGKGLAEIMTLHMNDDISGSDYKERMDEFQHRFEQSDPETAKATWLLGTFTHLQKIFLYEIGRAKTEFGELETEFKEKGLPEQDYEKRMRHILKSFVLSPVQYYILCMASIEESHLSGGEISPEGRATKINDQFLRDVELFEKGWAPGDPYMVRLRELMLGNLDNAKAMVAKLNPAAQASGEKQKGEAEEEFECPICSAINPADAKQCDACGLIFEAEPTIDEIDEKAILDTIEALESSEPVDSIKCPACGIHTDADSKECPVCGAILENEKVKAEETSGLSTEEKIAKLKKAFEEGKISKELYERSLAKVQKEEGSIVLREGEYLCPSCKAVVMDGDPKCMSCWADLTQFKRCESCGAVAPADEKVCQECFTSFPPKLTCPHCDAGVSEDDDMCPECGMVLVEDDVAEQEPTCPFCDAKVPDGDEICAECGMPLIEDEEDTENVPMKPVIGKRSISHLPFREQAKRLFMDEKTFECPTCMAHVPKHEPSCPTCGQLLDWGNSKGNQQK